MLLTRPVDLARLDATLRTAGITTAALFTRDAALYTYNAAGDPVDLPDAATPYVQAEQTTYATQQQQAATDAATLRQAVQSQVQALVGVSWTAMTAAQRQSLLVALLYKAGALDKTLTVQPLANWL